MEVLRFPHPALKAVCSPPEDDVGALVEGLLGLMESFPRCVGIAAPQVGEPVRVCVVDCSMNPKIQDHHGRLVLVDPVIESLSPESEVGREGCLSIPDLTANVRRASSVTVSARDVPAFEASGAFGWSVQSTTHTRASTPIWGAAMPTQRPKERMVSIRSSTRAETSPVAGAARRLRRGSG